MYDRPDERYPVNWSKLRFYIYKRDNYTCQRCGRHITNPVCHHRRPIGCGGSSHPSNLITLCKDCHSKVHERRI
jgi:5-methylcytosine-specific restriction enzyme A